MVVEHVSNESCAASMRAAYEYWMTCDVKTPRDFIFPQRGWPCSTGRSPYGRGPFRRRDRQFARIVGGDAGPR